MDRRVGPYYPGTTLHGPTLGTPLRQHGVSTTCHARGVLQTKSSRGAHYFTVTKLRAYSARLGDYDRGL